MSDIENDINNTSRLTDGRDCDSFSPVYFSTNECLDDIFSYIDVKDKKVLSVIGSGDQAFYFYNNGAKKVDLFDINKLAFYYYYLRVWTMKYLNRSYPYRDFGTRYIRDLLCLVTPSSSNEKEAYDYWQKFVDNFDVRCSDFMLISSFLDLDEDLYDDTNLFDKIGSYRPKFYNIDLTKKVNIKSKYDIIYTSNIHEYIEDDNSFKVYRDNLSKMLNRKGIVVSTNVMNDGPYEDERNIMGKKFKCSHFPNINYDYGIGITSLGYCYKKRKIHL